MKKKIFKVALAVVIMGAGFFVWQSQHSEPMSELVLANVEALASGELDENIWHRRDYTLDNGTPAVNCYKGGSDDCLL